MGETIKPAELLEALAACLEVNDHRSRQQQAVALFDGPLVPLVIEAAGFRAERDAALAAHQQVTAERDEARAELAWLRAEGEAKDRALKDERARRKAAVQSVREKAAALCDEAAAYFDRTTGHYDRAQAAGGYRATAGKIRLLTPDRTALARAATAREG